MLAAWFFFLPVRPGFAQAVLFTPKDCNGPAIKASYCNAGTIPAFIGVGDFDGDGKLDLAVVNSGGDDVSILLGNGDGTFSLPSIGILNAAISNAVTSIAVTETATPPAVPFTITIDSEQMTVTARAGAINPFTYTVTRHVSGSTAASHSIAASVAVNFRTGPVCTTPPAPCLQPTSVAVGDFNGDLMPDLAITNFATDEVVILLNTTTSYGPAGALNFGTAASFSLTSITGTLNAAISSVVTSIDVNETATLPALPFIIKIDSEQMIVTARAGAANPRTYTVTRHVNGSIAASHLIAASVFTGGNGPLYVAAGYFETPPTNLDLAVANFGNNGSPPVVGTTVSILIGNGDGTFQPAVPLSVGNNPAALAIGDFDNDGNKDVAVANFGSDSVSILPGNGDGTFDTQIVRTVGNQPISIVAGNFNGDAFDDIVVANQVDKSISVIPGDAARLFVKLSKDESFGKTPSEIVAADFNKDGAMDLAIATFPSHTIGILLGNGDGTFSNKITSFKSPTKGTGLFSIVAGNFDSNTDLVGKPDLAVPDGQVGILLNNTVPPPPLAAFHVTFPDTALDTLTVGTPATITWTPTGFAPTVNVKIDLSRDSGATWKNIAKTLNTGTRTWTVTAPTTVGATALIRVCSVDYPGICDQSDAPFPIN